MECADKVRSEVDLEGVWSDGFGSEFLIDEGLADEPLAFAPLPAALGIRMEPQPAGRIIPAWWSLGQAAGTGVINRGGRAQTAPFKRPAAIVALAPAFEATLLGGEVQGCRPASARFEHAVHLLMGGVVLRAARSAVLDAHS